MEKRELLYEGKAKRLFLTDDKDLVISEFKDDLTALRHLDMIRSTQLNWVNAGKTDANSKEVSHNVSCTVEVDKDEI